MVGYISSRSVKAVARASVSAYKGNRGSSSGKSSERLSATEKDADNYIGGLQEKGVLSKKIRTKDNHDCFKVEKKCEYMGLKLKKGYYLSRDTLHNEWELFRGPKNHKGAISSLTGKLDKNKARDDRNLKLP